jgi:hypothetical protein
MEMKNPSRGEPAGASISAQNQQATDSRPQANAQELARGRALRIEAAP